MELRQLEYFLAVAEEEHFGRAARRLHMSQPPLSVQVHKLERELAVTLFDRSSRRVRLTAAGMELARRLSDLLPRLRESVADLDQIQEGVVGSLRVGFVSSASYTLLPSAVRAFRLARPAVRLTLLPMTTAEQVEAVQEGGIDVGIVRDAAEGGPLRCRTLVSESLVVCLASDHPLAGRRRLDPADLADESMIAYPRRLMPGYVDLVREVFARGRMPRTVQKVVHQETALGFVAAGEGFTVLPESVRELLPGSIVAVPLRTRIRSGLQIISHPDVGLRAPAAVAFDTCLDEVCRGGNVPTAGVGVHVEPGSE